jgi:KipI family sensor histidine kinase inhibitor
MNDFKILPAGDTALVIEFGDCIDRKVNDRVLALARRLREAKIDGISEAVPTFRSLMICFDPAVLPGASLAEHITMLAQALPPHEQNARLWRLPICYDPVFALDLEEAAARLNLSPAQLVEYHSATAYHVYMLGFLPGQAYMGDLPQEIVLPRREMPRQRIPAGSVAIAMSMTCVFPMDTPCGWHLIGHSPVSLFQASPAPQARLAPGDAVRFAPVSRREHDDIVMRIDAGAYSFDPELQRIAA